MLFFCRFEVFADSFYGFDGFDWEHPNGGVGLVGGNVVNGLEGAEMKGAGGSAEHFGGFDHIFSRHDFSFGLDDDSPTLTFGFGFFGHGALEVCRKNNIFEFDTFDFNTPGVGSGIDNFTDAVCNFFTIFEKFIKGNFTNGVAHGGLGKLGGGVIKIFYFNVGFGSICNAVIDNGINLDRNVVFGDGFLTRNINGFDTDINFGKVLEEGDDDAPTGFFNSGITPHGQEDSTLVFINLFEEKDCKDGKSDD